MNKTIAFDTHIHLVIPNLLTMAPTCSNEHQLVAVSIEADPFIPLRIDSIQL
jgi:hypothetical protein